MDRTAEPQRLGVKEVEISEELAATIYSMWANAILDARYARRGLGLDGTSYSFSTSLRGVGWFSATAWEPKNDLPPRWLVDAGEQILEFGRAEHPSADQLHANLRTIRQRLREYSSRDAR
jgi:hypothetical protein